MTRAPNTSELFSNHERDAAAAFFDMHLHPSSDSPVSLRPVTSDDHPFLRDLFWSTREEEFRFLPLPESAKQALCKQQFDAQTRQYATRFPNADHVIVVRGEVAIGRMIVDHGAEALHLVDIALLPEHRNAGIGTSLLHRLLEEARTDHLPIRLSVVTTSPANRLYERLGFRPTFDGDDADSIYRSMECPFGAGNDR